MGKKLKSAQFKLRFEKQILSFIESTRLFTPSEPLYIAVSGGVDSMVLLYCIAQFRSFGYSNGISVIHINHGTRKEQIKEESLVRNFCLRLGVNFTSHKLVGLKLDTNFEATARKKRYELFDQLSCGHKVLLAHHIDDSFEWHLLQSFRSGRLQSTIGIPAKNGQYSRPFMAATKEQIIHYAKINQIPFLEDPSNNDLDFERNYLRNTVIPLIRKRHPRYLYHYVQQSNSLATIMKKNLKKLNGAYKITKSEKSRLFYSLDLQTDLSPDVLLENIISMSEKKRGQTSQQVAKLVKASANHKKGPLQFSGNVKAYLDDQLVLLSNTDFSSTEFVLEKFDKFSLDEFKQLAQAWLSDSRLLHCFPFWVILHDTLPIERRSFYSSYNSEIIKEFKGTHYIPLIKLLRNWQKPALQNKRITFSLVKVNKPCGNA